MAAPALQPVIKPEQTFKFSIVTWILDMRGKTDLLGEPLAELITRSVWKTQHPIMQALPDWLILTHQQFSSLIPFTEPIDDVEGRIFITPYNVMEVDVEIDQELMEQAAEGFDYHGLPSGGRFSQQ